MKEITCPAGSNIITEIFGQVQVRGAPDIRQYPVSGYIRPFPGYQNFLSGAPLVQILRDRSIALISYNKG